MSSICHRYAFISLFISKHYIAFYPPSQTNNNGATGMISTCGCTQDGTTNKDVCIKPPAAPNTEGKSCAELGITTEAACNDVCSSVAATETMKPDKFLSCTCLDGSGFSCTNKNNSSSALSLLLPGAVVTVTTYLIATVI